MEGLKNKIEYKMTNFNRVEIIKQDNLKNRVETRIQTRIEKIKKIKYEQKANGRNEKNKIRKNFSRQQPPPSTCAKGGGGASQNVCGIYSAGKYPDFALCVRTQNDFYLKGGITAHPNNKTRLKRFIYLYNGRYTRKQDGTRRKMNKYT